MGRIQKRTSKNGARKSPRTGIKIYPDDLPLPGELLKQYPQQYILYSSRVGRVVGAAKTEAEAFKQAHGSGVEGPWHLAYSEWEENSD